MAKKPIISIDIDDAKFKSFLELFDKYTAELDKMPESWKGANSVMNAGVAAIAEQTHSIAKHLHEATNAQKQFTHATKHGESGLKRMANEARKLSDSVLNIGKSLLKVGGLGLGGIGAALFGMDKLAGDAVATQYTARGLGITTGQERAFKLAYRRIMPTSVLGAIAGERNTPEGLAMLSLQTGIPIARLQGQNAAQIAPEVALELRKRSMGWTPEQRSAMMSAYGYTASGFTTEDARRLRNIKVSTILQAEQYEHQKSQQYNVTNAQTRSLWSFQRALRATSQLITTDLDRKLSTLGGPLSKLIHAIGGDASQLINAALSPSNLKAMQHGIQDFTHFLTSGEAKNAFLSFTQSIANLSNTLYGASQRIEKFFHHASAAKTAVEQEMKKRSVQLGGVASDIANVGHVKDTYAYDIRQWWIRHFGHGNTITGYLKDHMAAGWGAKAAYMPHVMGEQAYKNAMNYGGAIGYATRKYKLPNGLLTALIEVESGGLSQARSSAGALGLTQLMPGTAKAMGVKNPFDPEQNVLGGARYLAAMLDDARRFLPHASLTQQEILGLSMYNAGPGTLNKAISDDMAKYKGHWKSHLFDFLPKETKSYAPTILATQARNLKIHVHNSTSARVSVSANAAAH